MGRKKGEADSDGSAKKQLFPEPQLTCPFRPLADVKRHLIAGAWQMPLISLQYSLCRNPKVY